MIRVTRLNDIEMVVNAEQIQTVQATPDTLITFANQDRLMVKEPVEELSKRIVDYHKTIYQNRLSSEILQQFDRILN
jgi:flagellar protein FlbD